MKYSIGEIAKAITGAVTAAGTALGTDLQAHSHITLGGLISAIVGAVVAGGAVFTVQNSAPNDSDNVGAHVDTGLEGI